MANYNGFEYELVDDEVTITGFTGTMEDIVIPDFIDGYPVTIIGERAFLNYYRSSLVLPSQLRGIELGAFAGDNGVLTELIFPKSVEYIGDSAFHFNVLRNVYVYNSDTVFGTWALGDFRDVVIHGFRNSTAYDYAVEYGMEFLPIPLELESITQPDVINIGYDDELTLPESVQVELNNGETVSVNVDWEQLDTRQEGTFTVNGTLRLPGDIGNPDNLQPSVNVTISRYSVASIESVEDISVHYDEQPELPQSIDITLDNDEIISVGVSWDLSEFDNQTHGVYEVSGTLQLPDIYANPDDLQPNVTIMVVKRYIISFEAISDATIDHKDVDDFELPTSVVATLDDDETMDIPIEITYLDSFNGETTYGYIYDYRLNNPPSIDNPDELTGQFTLTVNKRYITSVSPIEPDSVEFGTGYQSLPMPSLIEVDYNDDTSGYLSIKWDMGTPTYESLNPQDYTFTGTLIIDNDVTYNRDNLTAEMIVTLNEKVPKSEKPAMSKEMYVFNADDEFVTIMSRDNGLIDTYFKDHQNNIVDEAFVFTVDNESELLHHIAEENQVAFYDNEGELRLMRIKEIYEESASEGHVLKAVAEPAYLELYDHFIEDRRIENGTAQTALNRALDGSRYIGEVTIQLDRETDNFYWINGVEAVFKILGTWGGALKDTIKINDKNEITERKLWIMARRGSDNGLIVEPDHNAESITRNTLSYPKTAMWGQGSSLEIEDEDGELTGGHTRYITFEDVEWSIANGDPADKPLGQKWIGDPQALARYGYLEDAGSRRHRFGHFSNQDYETPEELLWATWQALQEEKLKEVIHEAKIYEGDKPVNLGDTVTILNREYNKPIEVQSQITGLEYDILDDDEINIIIGKYVDMSDPIGDELDKIKDDIKNVSNRPNRVTENSYANIKPHRPFNVEAHGGYRQIQIYWTFTDELYVKHYEIYGSQISDFVPSEQNLLWKGNVSAFAHDVEMDEMWYYYVRAVNYHGTPSDYSDRVQANSMRDVSPDIMFGSIKSEQLEDYLDLAGKLDNGTLDWINEDVYEYVEELEEGIIADVNETIGTVANSVAHLVNRMDDTDEIIQTHEVLIQENHDAILQRVTSQELNTVENTFNQAMSEIEQKADGISQRVEQTNVRIDNIDLGGTNFITHLPENWVQGYIGQNSGDLINRATSISTKDYFRVDGGVEYTLNAYEGGRFYIRFYTDSRNYIPGTNYYAESRSFVTFITPQNARLARVYVNSDIGDITPDQIGVDTKTKLSLGNEPTGWTPNLDDTGELVSQVQSYVSEFNQRADSIELSVADVSTDLEDGLQDLKVNAIAYINITPGDIKIGGDKVTITGETFIENGVIGTAAIANLAVSKAHLKNAIIDDAHVNNLSGNKIIAGTITTDKLNVSNLQAISANMGTLTAGILRSSNNNMELNLNRGTLRMSNAAFTLGGGATIDFTSRGNRITYRYTSGITRSAGMGVGVALGDVHPFTYLGTTGASELDTLSQYYSGFIANTTARIADGGANSINGNRLELRNSAVGYNKGLIFNWFGNRPSISTFGSSNYDYEIGTFQRLLGKQNFEIRNYFNESSGWLMETNYASDGTDITMRGINGNQYNYAIGESSSTRRIRNIFLRNNPNVSSDRRLKEDFNSLENSADILRELNPVSYRYKLTNADINSNIKRNKVQFGLIYQDVVPTFEKHGYNTSDLNMTQLSEDGLGSLIYQEITPHLIKGWQDHDKLINEIDIRIEDKDRRIKRLEKKVSKLEEAVA